MISTRRRPGVGEHRQRPVVVVRNSTERPGCWEPLWNWYGRTGDRAGGGEWLDNSANLANIASPYGTGQASRQSVDALEALLADIRVVYKPNPLQWLRCLTHSRTTRRTRWPFALLATW